MKKLSILFLSFVCLSSLSVFADSPCDKEVKQKPKTSCEKPCPKTYTPSYKSRCFLCTDVEINTLLKQMCLSETQICNAHKIQDKYEQEVLSLCERIDCENVKYNQLKQACAKSSELRKQKRLIRKLERKRKDICKCYEKEFKTTLSKDQIKSYNKIKRNN